MDSKITILKNTAFLTVQPILMNFISLFVIGYIARKLGSTHFGIFNFVTTFTMLFYPIAVFGLNRVNVRDLSREKNKNIYTSKMFPLRSILILFAVVIINIVAYFLRYDQITLISIFLASFILLFQLFSEYITEVFNSSEKMEYTALIKMSAGLLLTILSVLVLYFDLGLYGLLSVYIIGQLTGVILAFTFLQKKFFKFKVKFDFSFITEKIYSSFSFFILNMLWFTIIRVDTVILSKYVSMAQIGIYTSALLLVRKLSIVSQGLSNAILPTITRLRSEKKDKEISEIINLFLSKIFFISFFGCIIVTFFSKEIINLIFGDQYIESASILSISIWVFLFRCISQLEYGILVAFEKQKIMLHTYIISAILCIISNFILISMVGILGAAIAFTITQLFITIIFTIFIFIICPLQLKLKMMIQIFGINLLVIVLILVLKQIPSIPFFFTIPVCSIVYLLLAHLTKIIPINSLLRVKNSI